MDVDLESLIDCDDTFASNVVRMHKGVRRHAAENREYRESRIRSMGDMFMLLTSMMRDLGGVATACMLPGNDLPREKLLVCTCGPATTLLTTAEHLRLVRPIVAPASVPLPPGRDDIWENGRDHLEQWTLPEMCVALSGPLEESFGRPRYSGLPCLHTEFSMRLAEALDTFWQFDQCCCIRCGVSALSRVARLFVACMWAAEGLGLCRPAGAASAKSGRAATGDGAGAHHRRRGPGR